MAEAHSFTELDDERVRVTRWTFARKGDATGQHVHHFDYVVIPVTGGELRVVSEEGAETAMVQVAGGPYRGLAGTCHNVVSASGKPVVFVEVELTGGAG